MSVFGVVELDWPVQSPDLNPIEALWDELEQRLRPRPSCPASVCDLFASRKIPTNTLLNLVEIFPREVEPVVAVKGGPTSY